MTQIEAIYLQARAPIFKIGFVRIAHGGVAGKACGDNKIGASAQKFNARLIPDFHAAARQQGDTPMQIGELSPLAKVQIAAPRAQLIVEMVGRRMMLFANVAMLCFEKLAGFGISVGLRLIRLDGRKHIWRGEYGSAPQSANAGLRPNTLVTLQLRGLVLALHGLEEATPGRSVWTGHLAGGEQKTGAFLGRYRREESAVCYNRFEKFGSGVKTGCK